MGIDMALVAGGHFKMGGGDIENRPDALPVHQVTLADYEISKEPISFALFQAFYQDTYQKPCDRGNIKGYVVGVSWYEAEMFCQWLGAKEGKTYRLPTEAEWEYAAKHSLAYGIDRMCDLHLREWCFDWYDSYTHQDKTNPGGSEKGFCKVVRGGFLDNPLRYNAYPLDLWMRGSLPPSFSHYPGDPNDFGRHNIGFRIVQGATPVVAENTPHVPFVLNVKAKAPPFPKASSQPIFQKRHLFPTPPDNAHFSENAALGLNPVLRHHNHSPGLAAAPNGDVLVVIYSSYHEYDAEVGLMAARLRYGAQAWDMPDIFLNPVGVNDHAPCMFTDTDGTIFLFWGWQQLDSAFPFQYVSSTDHGQTWSPIQFPHFTTKVENFVKQPINSCIHAKDGYYYLACDAEGSQSVLWRTKDLIHWEAPKGRTAGRHSTAVELKDGSLLAIGGKNSNMDGFMPKAVSTDHGDSWTVSKTPFPAMTSGQRPSVIRLQSGLLLMCGDYQNKQGLRPQGVDTWGCYAAFSADEGESWTIKTLPGTQPRKKHPELYMAGASTLGYSAACQTPDGMIHIITTNNYPCLHFSFNEAWLTAPVTEPVETHTPPTHMESTHTYQETYPNGHIKCQYTGGIADNGAYLLHGEEIWYYPCGGIKTKATYHLGELVGDYIYYQSNGHKVWAWHIDPRTQLAAYTTYYHNGQVKSKGHYQGKFAQGAAQSFDINGQLTSDVMFHQGKIISQKEIMPQVAKDGPIGGEKLEG